MACSSVKSTRPGHRPDLHFADALRPSLLKRLLQGREGCGRMTELSPTAIMAVRKPNRRPARYLKCHVAGLRRRPDRHSAAPPSRVRRRFHADGEAVSAQWQSRRRRLGRPTPRGPRVRAPNACCAPAPRHQGARQEGEEGQEGEAGRRGRGVSEKGRGRRAGKEGEAGG